MGDDMKKTISNEVLFGEVCCRLAEGKKVKLRAKGDSMWPFIKGEKDVLVIDPVKELKKWDVVLAKVDVNRYIVHRIVKIENERIILMGDGNLYQKEDCRRADVFGRVERIIRNRREINLMSRSSRFRSFVWYLLLHVRRFMR